MGIHISHEKLKELFRCDPEKGLLYWIKGNSRNVAPGAIAGTVNLKGYRYVEIDGIKYCNTGLIWYYVHGEYPRRMDHEDRNPTNDCLTNIRPCTRAQNRHNAKTNANNEAGIKGVRQRRDNLKWQARIQVDGRPVSLGHFNTKEEAASAYEEGARKYYGKFSSTGDGVGEGTPPPPPVWTKINKLKQPTCLEDIFGPRRT